MVYTSLRRFPNGQFAPSEWKPIKSSNLAFGAATETKLYVEFTSGSVYRYDIADADEILEMLVAAGEDEEASAGSEFHHQVNVGAKAGAYRYEQVM
jgi:hypothetical protein